MNKICFFTVLYASFCLFSLHITPVHAVSVSGQGTWEATLQARDLDGNTSTIEGWYDTDLNITWLADSNLAASQSFGVTTINPDGSGTMTWYTAIEFVQAMNSYNGGNGWLDYNAWRLPITNPINGIDYNYTFSYDGSTDYAHNISAPGSVYAGSTASELAHMFFSTLGNIGWRDTAGNLTGCSETPPYCLTNTGMFSSIQSNTYWSETEYGDDLSKAWHFHFEDGVQDGFFKDPIIPDPLWDASNVWVVADGAIGAAIIPIPPAFWLFGTGLLGFIGMAIRKKA